APQARLSSPAPRPASGERRHWRLRGAAGRSQSSRVPPGLESARAEAERAGGTALALPVDVSNADALAEAAEQVIERWESFDVWVTCAMATIFGPSADVSATEFRRVTEVTYLGYVFGTMAALKHMRPRNHGTIVQVGSALSYRAIPLQSAHCGAKFAVRGFTDALRSELLHEGSAIRVTMVQHRCRRSINRKPSRKSFSAPVRMRRESFGWECQV